MMTYIIKSYSPVSILVLMDLCIKTVRELDTGFYEVGFNPCFNGTMYKNHMTLKEKKPKSGVSILVLMELCIKT